MLKDTTRCRLWGWNPGPLDSESDALPLRHRAPLTSLCFIAKPEYIGGTQEFINASVGQSVLLPCQASAGYPPPSVTFSPMIDPTGQNRFSVSTKGMYIQNVQLGDRFVKYIFLVGGGGDGTALCSTAIIASH